MRNVQVNGGGVLMRKNELEWEWSTLKPKYQNIVVLIRSNSYMYKSIIGVCVMLFRFKSKRREREKAIETIEKFIETDIMHVPIVPAFATVYFAILRFIYFVILVLFSFLYVCAVHRSQLLQNLSPRT